MRTQSQVDCQKLFSEKYGVNPSDFSSLWDNFYNYESNRPFQDELIKDINSILPDENCEEIYKILLTYFEDAKRRRRFYKRFHPNGYGFEVFDRNGGKPKLMLHTYDGKKAEDYLEALKADENAIAPDTSEEIPPRRILVIKERHGDWYFSADTPKEYKSKAVSFIMSKYDDLSSYQPRSTDIKEVLGLTKEEINALPEGEIKKRALEQFTQFQDEIKEIKRHIYAFDSLNAIKENGENCKLSDIAEVFNFWYEHSWVIEDLQ